MGKNTERTMEAELQELGLSKNESEIYLYLLKTGETTTGRIMKNTGIANSRVYAALDSLQNKGLANYTIQKNGKHFSASDPHKLAENEEERLERIRKLMPQLSALQNTTEAKTMTAVYEGFQGFKTAFKKIINDCPEDETIKIIGFSDQVYGNESLKTFLKNMNLKSAQKRQKLKIIIDAESSLREDRKAEPYNEIRILPKGFVSPAAMDIFGDWVYILLWDKEPYVFSIKNEKIAKSFTAYFDVLWNMARTDKSTKPK